MEGAGALAQCKKLCNGEGEAGEGARNRRETCRLGMRMRRQVGTQSANRVRVDHAKAALARIVGSIGCSGAAGNSWRSSRKQLALVGALT